MSVKRRVEKAEKELRELSFGDEDKPPETSFTFVHFQSNDPGVCARREAKMTELTEQYRDMPGNHIFWVD